MASLGKLAMSTEISNTIVQRRMQCLYASMSNLRDSASKKVSTFNDARLQAVSSRNMYSEQLCTVRPLAMKEPVIGSVRSKTCCLPSGVTEWKWSQFPKAARLQSCGFDRECEMAVASCSSFLPG